MSLPGLIVDVEARIDKLERGLKRANSIQRSSSSQMEQRAEQSAQRVRASYGKAADGVAASLKRMALPLLGGLLAADTIKNMQASIGQVASLGDEAKRAGVSLDALQQWKFVGQQNRIGIDAIVDGLKELNLRSDEFILTKSGPAAEAFGRLGYSASDLQAKLKNPSELLLEIIGRLEDVDKAGQIRIADEIFGGSAGERFVELIGTGETGLRNMMQQARDTGAVLDADLIEKAQELDRRWAALTTRTSNWFKTFSVEAADAAVRIVTMREDLDDMFRSSAQARSLLGDGVVAEIEATTDAADQNAEAIGQLRQRYETLGDQGDVVAQQLEQASNIMRSFGYDDQATAIADVARNLRQLSGDMREGNIDAEAFETGMADLTSQAQTAFAEIDAIDRVEFSGAIAGVGGLIRKLGEAIGFARTLRATLPGADPRGTTVPVTVAREVGSFWDDPANEELVNPATTKPVLVSPRPQAAPFELGVPDLPPPPEPENADSVGGGRSERKTQSDYIKEIASITEETAALKAEAQALLAVAASGEDYGDAMEFAQAKADLLMAAHRSGLALTPELEAQITDLAAAQTRAGVAADQAADRIRAIQDAGREGAQAVAGIFTQMASGSMTATQALGGLLLQMAKVALQKRLMAIGENGGAAGNVIGFIGKALSGGFSDGGYTGHGGKHDPAGVVHRGEYVVSAAATRKLGVSNLDALHTSALKGYASGGFVGSSTKPLIATPSQSQQSVNINAPVTVNASGGTSVQNADLAKQMAREVEQSMKSVVVEQIRKQLRPGNMLNQGRR
ncbi:hypothetical protein FHS72_002836 [Loktanella ponticola]|uniref:Phage tail tape measure protein n=1 Tax=Yoonia ponticola TaxID=1524255 RepID=A0A7W9BMD9_9RHOB|nr:hypothetical protein [Yoonia ponticola]MBB5723199.1 hypothetical protein [Yoonia ponticola]